MSVAKNTTTIRCNISTRDRLRRMACKSGRTIQNLVDSSVASYEAALSRGRPDTPGSATVGPDRAA